MITVRCHWGITQLPVPRSYPRDDMIGTMADNHPAAVAQSTAGSPADPKTLQKHLLLELAARLLVASRGCDGQRQWLPVQIGWNVNASQVQDGWQDVLVCSGGLQHLTSLYARTPVAAGNAAIRSHQQHCVIQNSVRKWELYIQETARPCLQDMQQVRLSSSCQTSLAHEPPYSGLHSHLQ